jgi:hypothetical protein
MPIHLILSAGTRIVTRNPVNLIGGRGEVPTGSVATITLSAADATHAYKVRPDYQWANNFCSKLGLPLFS